MKHLFIVNPIAGGRRGKAGGVQNEIEEFAKTQSDPVEVYFTIGPMDACRKVKEETSKLTQNENGDVELFVYACGGDGTLNECINGAVGCTGAAVAHYPCGTGNDFIKTFSSEKTNVFQNIYTLSRGTVKAIDVIDCGCRYGINICSVGIDARIGTDVHKYSNIPIIGGATGYIVSLIVNVIKGVTQKLHITCGGVTSRDFSLGSITAEDLTGGDKVFNREVTLACICNGRYYGGGFNPVPDALPDDGVLECLIVEPVSRLRVAQIVGRYAKGRFREFPDVFNYVRCTEVVIDADSEFVVNIDGERVDARKIKFKLIPKGVNFIFPQGLTV